MDDGRRGDDEYDDNEDELENLLKAPADEIIAAEMMFAFTLS